MYYSFSKEGDEIAFGQSGKELHIMYIYDRKDPNSSYSINLNEEDLFELIGGLLRIQSKIKEVSRG